MLTVKEWAAANGFDYSYIDDRLFEYTPTWYREKAAHKICVIADLARAELAKEYLSSGYKRTVWIDADVVIFDAPSFKVAIPGSHAFCREVWLDITPEKKLRCLNNINNAVTVFTGNSEFLDFYIYACKENVRTWQGQNIPAEINIRFLTAVFPHLRFPLLNNVGLFSPFIMNSLVTGDDRLPSLYMQKFGSTLCAANLCLSFRNKAYNGIYMPDSTYEQVIKLLLETKGKVINRHFMPKRVD